MSDHWTANCPKSKRKGAGDEPGSNTPYQRQRSNGSLAGKGEAIQGSNTLRMIRGVWRDGPMVEKKDIEMLDSGKEPEVPERNPKTKKQKHKQEIDEVVEQLAKFERPKRKKEGNEEGHEENSNYWLRLK